MLSKNVTFGTLNLDRRKMLINFQVTLVENILCLQSLKRILKDLFTATWMDVFTSTVSFF